MRGARRGCDEREEEKGMLSCTKNKKKMKGGNKSKTLFLAILKFCCAGGICNNKHIHLFSRPNLDLACLRSQTFFSDLFLRLVFDFIAEKKMKKEGLHHSPLFFFFFWPKMLSFETFCREYNVSRS